MDSIEKQVQILMQGTEFGDTQIKTIMEKELAERLDNSHKTGIPLKVYCGYDVTAPDIHLGHTITMRKLRQFQDLGHEVFFVIGTFTTLIGDPSDRDQARSAAGFEKILLNAVTYAEQAFKILDKQKTIVCYNHEWLRRLNFEDVIKLASNFSVQQYLVRDRLRKRIEANEPLWLSELLYPLAQGFDAVHLETDVQIGGTEQLFNLMAGRKLQEIQGQRPQVCLAFPLLPGLDGKHKMSKSLGNYVGVNESPETQFGKIMSLPDQLIITYFRLVSRWSPEQIAELEAGMNEQTIHPMSAKKQLAFEIISGLQGEKAAQAAGEAFNLVHQKREIPVDMPEFKLTVALKLSDLLIESGLCASKSEAKRLVLQNGVKIDGCTANQPDRIIEPQKAVLQKGRNTFIRLTI